MMNNCNCNKPKDCGCNPCGGGCEPARYDGCTFDIQADPYNSQVWNVIWCGIPHKITLPPFSETDTFLSTDYSNATLNYKAERHTDKITGAQLGDLIKVEDLRDAEIDMGLDGNCYEFIYHKYGPCGEGCQSLLDRWTNFNINSEGAQTDGLAYLRGANEYGCPEYLEQPDNCSLLVFSPSCDNPTNMWQAYTIPDAGDCVMEPESDGYYRVLKKDDCGCIRECKLPVIPNGMTSLNFVRDSVPDDPDFPWYYGSYNDTINLHLAENAPQYFGKYALKVTINYGVQAIKSLKFNYNYNWRSLIVPVVQGEDIKVTSAASILQTWCIYEDAGAVDIPWGSSSLRGSITLIVPKGKEAYLHHEYRVRTKSSFPNREIGAWDGQIVPNAEATLGNCLHPASRLNALQVIIEPTQGDNNYTPTADTPRSQLDPAVDAYQPNV